jgi:hypothetical protein
MLNHLGERLTLEGREAIKPRGSTPGRWTYWQPEIEPAELGFLSRQPRP